MVKDKKKKPQSPSKGMTLTNQEIFAACVADARTGEPSPLAKLMEQKFHVRVSYNLAKLASKLQEPLAVIQEVRNGIIKKYGKADEANPQQISVPTIIEKIDAEGKVIEKDGKLVMEANPDFGKFLDEMTELMAQEETIDFGKLEIPVKLPEKVASTCDKCHHNMDRDFEIEPAILLALEKFIEV